MGRLAFWIDLANSPHVVFFRPIIERLRETGHEVMITARDFAQTRGLAERWGIEAIPVGGHGGRSSAGKLLNLLVRAIALRKAVSGRRLDIALSHNSYSQILAARTLGLRVVTLMDFEHTPANRLAFRLAHKVIVPAAWPPGTAERLGASPDKVRRYDGLKEEVYLWNFAPDAAAKEEIERLIGSRIGERLLATVRPPPSEAIYHRFDNPYFEVIMDYLAGREDAAVVVLPRSEAEKRRIAARRSRNFYIPERPLDGPTLLYLSDAVIGAGGTMNREAAVLGTAVYTIFAGKQGAVDRFLIERGRMVDLKAALDASPDPAAEISRILKLHRCGERSQSASPEVLNRVMGYILEEDKATCRNSAV
ncbi:MAG: DUF354 domain-containing protein [Planctomycetota bacterium]|nr:DUF354 domain-containing protein [Planctomycetota bacterium]